MTSPSNFEPSNLDMFVAEITGNADSDYNGVQRQVPFRIQGHLYAKLTALMGIYDMHAREKGRRSSSRNKVLNDLLAISLDAVLSRLGTEDMQVFEQLHCHASDGALVYLEEEDMEDFKKELKAKRAKDSNNEPV